MPTLDLIWSWTLALNGVVAASAAALLLRRFVHDVARRHGARRRAKTIKMLLSPIQARPSSNIFRHRSTLTGLLHILTLLRGRDCARVVERARLLGAPLAFQRALRRGSARQRMNAAEALGFFQGDCSRVALSRAVSDPDARVGIAAMQSLVQLGDGAALVSLLARIRESGAGRQSALAAILREAAQVRPADMARALAREKQPGLQVLLIDAVAAARMNKAVATLRELAINGESSVQTAARQALLAYNPATRAVA